MLDLSTCSASSCAADVCALRGHKAVHLCEPGWDSKTQGLFHLNSLVSDLIGVLIPNLIWCVLMASFPLECQKIDTSSGHYTVSSNKT